MAEPTGNNQRRAPTAAPNRRPASSPRPAVSTGEPAGSASSGARRPARAGTAPGIPNSYIIIGAVVVVLIIGAAVGYGPFMRYRYTSALDTAATLDERKSAAAKLYERRDGAAFGIFQERLGSTDKLTRDASAHGMSLIALDGGSQGVSATDQLCTAISKQDDEGKKALANLLPPIVKTIPKPDGDKKLPDEHQHRLDAIAKTLIPLTTSADAQLRTIAVEALGSVPAVGSCVALIAAATNDADPAIKLTARRGISATAMPDAVEALLKAMTSADMDLKTEASTAFIKVRDKAKSDDLLPLVGNTDVTVRKEIVAALGKRHADSKAAEGVTRALKDSSPEIRKLAVRSLQMTGISGPANQLTPLVLDPDPAVRMQCAETFGELRDDASKKALIESFASNPEPETMKALSKALGKRSSGKELSAIGIVMGQVKANPAAFASLREALVVLTNANQGAKRDAERRAWTQEKWNEWWENLQTREKLRDEAVAKLEEADKLGKADTERKTYPKLSKMTDEGIDTLGKCIEMSKPNDTEDIAGLEQIQKRYSNNAYQFKKFQTLDESHRK